ncbi:MAG TPA: PAS domain-containing sensor histidine kinase [Candidatus Kapabacteria bacterium]|nr:PAS domain-containing sensor histidine kinase [Candidatus Kapabacteria bacterium]
MKHEVALQDLADAMPLMTWIANETGETIYLNARWTDFAGRSLQTFTDAVYPADLERVNTKWHEAIAAGQTFEGEYRMVNAYGDPRWFLVRAVRFVDKKDGAIRYYGTCTDVHEQKLISEALREASEAKDRFLATLSHELRTPLTPINSLIGVLREDPGLIAEDPSILDIIQRNLDAELRLIDDLLDLSRIITGKFTVNMERVDIHELLRESAAMVHPEFLKCDVKIRHEQNARRHYVSGDAHRLNQVFSNLLKNAAKFSHAGQTVTISTNDVDGDLVVSIKDEGIGIEPRMLQQIFEPFEQTEQGSLHRYQGLGLGLTIAKRIVELHEGKISAESRGKNQGTTLHVRLKTV